jgi:hypothetical protein
VRGSAFRHEREANAPVRRRIFVQNDSTIAFREILPAVQQQEIQIPVQIQIDRPSALRKPRNVLTRTAPLLVRRPKSTITQTAREQVGDIVRTADPQARVVDPVESAYLRGSHRLAT